MHVVQPVLLFYFRIRHFLQLISHFEDIESYDSILGLSFVGGSPILPSIVTAQATIRILYFPVCCERLEVRREPYLAKIGRTDLEHRAVLYSRAATCLKVA